MRMYRALLPVAAVVFCLSNYAFVSRMAYAQQSWIGSPRSPNIEYRGQTNDGSPGMSGTRGVGTPDVNQTEVGSPGSPDSGGNGQKCAFAYARCMVTSRACDDAARKEEPKR
jgi:hypothetical protein